MAQLIVAGNAQPGQVLVGSKFSAGPLMNADGTMPNNGTPTFQPSNSNQTLAAGYYGPTTTIAAVSGTANQPQVLSGYSFSSSNGVGLSGTMPNQALIAPNGHATAIDRTMGVLTLGNPNNRVYLRPPLGYYDGTVWTAFDEPNLIQSNVRAGINYLNGMIGTLDPAYFAYGTASNPKTSGSWTLSNDTQNTFLHKITVTGLGFKPKYVFIIVGSSNYTWYNGNASAYTNIPDWTKVFSDTGNGLDMREYNAKSGASSQLSVTNGGFVLPVGTNNTSSSVTYWAMA